MKRLVFIGCVSAACGGAAASGGDTAKIVVPTQPPQPVATALPSASVDASAPIANAPVVPFECKTGTRFDVGDRSYCGYTDAMGWDAAEHRCVENGGHLATFDSRATSEALKKALRSPIGLPLSAWIGLEQKKVGTKKEWRWLDGTALGTAASWSTGEPNDFYGDGTEACAEWLVADGHWNDTRCNIVQPSVCQWPAKVSTPAGCESRVVVGDTQYCLDSMPRTFADAKKSCEARKGVLAMPKGAASEELRKAWAARFMASRFWIGLNDTNEEGTWAWTSGARYTFQAWHRGEPNDYDEEDCVEVFGDTWTWNDFDCAAPKASLCESPPKKK